MLMVVPDVGMSIFVEAVERRPTQRREISWGKIPCAGKGLGEMTGKLKLSEDYLLQKRDAPEGDDFLFDIQNGSAYRINSSTYDFLSLCDGSFDYDGVIRRFCESYQVSPEQAKSDFDPLVNKWVEMKILILG